MKRHQHTQQYPNDTAVISAKGTARVRDGHLWIYRSDVIGRPKVETGSIVRVVDNRGRFVAQAHFGAESEITLRLISKEEIEINREFWRGRLLAAAGWRRRIVTDTDAYRLIHSEGDYLPGLIIDRYGDCFVLQTLTRGMDALKPMWTELLVEEFQPRLIVERNDAKVRQLEGLPMINSVLYSKDGSNAAEFVITENGIKFHVDLLGGQKTGAFLDQRENRAAVMNYASGRGLDCFSFHGSFALHLASDCDTVTAIDISEPAIERGAPPGGIIAIACHRGTARAQDRKRTVQPVIVVRDCLPIGEGLLRTIAIGIVARPDRTGDAVHGQSTGSQAAEPVIGVGHPFAHSAIKPGVGLKPAQIVTVIDIAGVCGIEPAAFGYDFGCDPVQRIVVVGEDRAVALAQARAVAVGVVSIGFVVGRVVSSGRGQSCGTGARAVTSWTCRRREVPRLHSVQRHVDLMRPVTLGIDQFGDLAIGRVAVGYLGNLDSRADTLAHLRHLAVSIVDRAGDPVCPLRAC